MADTIKTLPPLMRAEDIYQTWQIPRKMLNDAAHAPVDAIDQIIDTRNGVTRKFYRTAEIVAHFNCDMTGYTIAKETT